MKNSVLFLALVASVTMQAQVTGRVEHDDNAGGYKPIGPVHREIAESSPVATAVIERTTPGNQLTPFKIAIRFTIRNISDHELSYTGPLTTLDVHNIATGQRAEDGPYGCYVHFFSKCYTPSIPRGIPAGGVKPLQIPKDSTFEDVHLVDGEYKLQPGQYSVVGYFCATQGEGPECFKSNTITITISPAAK